MAPNRSAWTMVAETSAATAAHPETIHVTGGLPATTVHVWASSLRGPGQFLKLSNDPPHDGTFTTVLRPGYLYTFTTTAGQSRAGGQPAAVPAAVSAAGPMPLPYTATPDGAGMATMLAPVEGSFGYVHGTLTQTTVGQPVNGTTSAPASPRTRSWATTPGPTTPSRPAWCCRDPGPGPGRRPAPG